MRTLMTMISAVTILSSCATVDIETGMYYKTYSGDSPVKWMGRISKNVGPVELEYMHISNPLDDDDGHDYIGFVVPVRGE